MEKKIHKARKNKHDVKLSKDTAVEKAEKLKSHMRNDPNMTDEEYFSIMNEVHESEMCLKEAEKK